MSLRLALRQITTNLLRATDAGRDVLFNSPDGWEVEQPALWWWNPNGTLGGGPFGNPIPGANSNGYGTIPAVDNASRLIYETIAALPWHCYRNETERLTTPDWLADPQMLRVDGRVVDSSALIDTRQSRFTFWGQWILAALWYGDGFVYVPGRDETGAPRPPLWQFHPHDVEIKNGRYWVAEQELAPSSIMHLRRMPVVDGRGTGVLDQFAADLMEATALREYTTGAFTAGVPAGYLKANVANLSQDQADALKSRWLAQHGNARRSIAVLNATTELHPLTWSPVDLAAADFSRISLNKIANMFKVPAYLLGGSTDGMTYSNVESEKIQLYSLCLLPWIKNIESVLSAELPRGTETRIEIDGYLRADSKTRAEVYALALDPVKGWMTRDEVRALENSAPIEGEAAVL